MSENEFINRTGDADLLTRVGIALTMRLSHTLHAVHIHVDKGTVTLRGMVPTFYDRQLAIEVTRRVAGVLRVHDEITVAAQYQGTKERKISHTHSREAANVSHGAGTEASKRSSASAVVRRSGWKSLFANAATVVRGLFLAVAVMGVIGCGSGSVEPQVPVFPAAGTITLKGQPMPGAQIILHPTTPTADVPNPRAQVANDGTFKLSTFGVDDGAPEGTYKMTVLWYKLPPNPSDMQTGVNVIPRKYTQPQTTNIEVKVAAGQNDLSTIKL